MTNKAILQKVEQFQSFRKSLEAVVTFPKKCGCSSYFEGTQAGRGFHILEDIHRALAEVDLASLGQTIRDIEAAAYRARESEKKAKP